VVSWRWCRSPQTFAVLPACDDARFAVLPACDDARFAVLPACGDAEFAVLPACGDAELVGLGRGLALGLAELEGVAGSDSVLLAGAVGLAEPVLADPVELVVGLGGGFVADADAGGAVGSSDAALEACCAGDVVGGVGPRLVHVLARTE
jgi:hypothetical protein